MGNVSAKNSVTPATSSKNIELKRGDGRINCSKSSALLLFLIAVAAVILTAFVTYWITKGIYDHSAEFHPFVAEEQYETSTVSQQERFNEDEDTNSPTAEELRLPRTLFPLWYNVTFKIEPEKNLTFEAAMIMKFKANETTDKIVLNSLKLTYPETNKIKITTDIRKNQGKQEQNSNESGNLAVNSVRMRHRRSDNSTEDFIESGSEKETKTKIDEKQSNRTENKNLQKADEGRTAAKAQVKSIVINETVEMVTFELTDKLEKGETYYIVIYYSGIIGNKLAGLYLSRYLDDNGNERLLAATQMEPTDARRMVPCFDEPDFKAVWKVRVIHPKGTKAISNGIEIKNAVSTDKSDWVLTSFQESLPMSSYLLAILVSDFDYNEGKTSRGTRFYATKDLVALPDFAAGAMENWGLITYRERALLYDERLYTPFNKLRVALVIAHELSHQWFGNLVTMKWWNDLWLNEGFATFMEYKGADAISKGNFRMSEYFLIDALQAALQRDARASSHPLIFNIAKAEDVSEAFDDISYEKGGSIINMVQNIMGKENFKKGLNVRTSIFNLIYLESHKYGNAAHKDLWAALNEAISDDILAWDGSKLDIGDFAAKWTEQMGYPVVEMKRIDEKQIELHQRRFKLDDNALEKEKYRNAKYCNSVHFEILISPFGRYKYDIPLWYSIDGEKKPMTWLHECKLAKKRELVLIVTVTLDVNPNQVFVLNTESQGFYRVNYNKECWEKIISQLMTNCTQMLVKVIMIQYIILFLAIDARSRARIIDDAFALAEAGHLPYYVTLNITQYLKKETELLPWTVALSGFGMILRKFGDEPEVQFVREYVKDLVEPLYNRIDWTKLAQSYMNDEAFFQSELEIGIIRRLFNIRDINCTEKMYEMFKTDLVEACQNTSAQASECSRVPIPVRGLVYCEGVRDGAERNYELMLDLYKRERVQVERERILSAMACSRDSVTLKNLMDLASNLNDTTIRLQDAPSVFNYISYGSVGTKIIFDYFQDNWPRLYNELKDQQTLLRRIISASLNLYNEREIIELQNVLIIKMPSKFLSLSFYKILLKSTETRPGDWISSILDWRLRELISSQFTLWVDRHFQSLTEWFQKQNELRKNS
uniref:Aminopeptidase n=1 Tax=Syphacia muris TaxID=451379 RepID=A0A0N5A7P6_9BILA